MQQPEQENPLEETRMTLGEHLDELRRRFMWAGGAVLIVFFACWGFRDQITGIILRPGERAVGRYDQARVEIYEAKLAEDPTLERADYFASKDPDDTRLSQPTSWPPFADGASGGFFFLMKCCFYFSMFIAGPVVLLQMWLFIGAGMYKHERRAVYRYLPASVLLFLAGVLFGYFMMVPNAYYYVAAMAIDTVTLLPKVDVYFTFLSSLSLAMGAVFQLPILMIALARMGLIDVRSFAKYRGHFALVSLVLAAIITPPDPYTQIMMAAPMVLLYEVGLHLARLFMPKSSASLAP